MADNSAYVYDLSVGNDAADDDVDDEFMKLTEEVLSGEAMNGSYSNSIDSNDGDVRGSNDGADEDTNYSNTDDSNNGGLDDDDDDSISNGRSDEAVNEDVTMEVEELEGNDKVEEGMIAWLMRYVKNRV